MNALTTTEQTSVAIGDPLAFLFDSERMRSLISFAEMMAKAHVTVPKHLHNKPSDCLAITLQAMRWRMDPFVVASKTHVVNGNLGYEAQLVVAVVKNSGAIKGRPHYEYKGDGTSLECRAGFVPAGEDAIVWGEWLVSSAIKVRNSPLWATNPKQQFGYLQARNWARLYAPDALLGVYTPEELEVMPPRHLGAADVVRSAPSPAPEAPEHYPAAEFDKLLPTWRKHIAAGRKTAQELIDTIETKGLLSEEQKQSLRNCEQKPEPEPEPELKNIGPHDAFLAEMDAASGGAQ
jgi:hypothetical protein